MLGAGAVLGADTALVAGTVPAGRLCVTESGVLPRVACYQGLCYHGLGYQGLC